MDLSNGGIGNRITYIITVSLTLVALLLSAGFDVPKSSYSNMMTIYLNGCFIFTFCMMFGMCYISSQYVNDDFKLLSTDLALRNAVIVVWTVFNMIFYYQFFYRLYLISTMRPLNPRVYIDGHTEKLQKQVTCKK